MLSQRGYCPEDLFKQNQDRYIVAPGINGEKSSIMLGVFDGHGTDGHECADLVQPMLVDDADLSGTARAGSAGTSVKAASPSRAHAGHHTEHHNHHHADHHHHTERAPVRNFRSLWCQGTRSEHVGSSVTGSGMILAVSPSILSTF